MRLLLAEDEVKLAQSLKKALETEHFAVDLAYDGESAYEEAAVNEYDVLILDLGLPKLDGIEVSKKLRAEKNKIPILMLTARDTVTAKIKGLDSGADDYLVKPFEFKELLARIRALLRRSQKEPSLLLTIGELTLDPVSHVVKRKGKEVELSAKEYALLEYLMRNSGHILSKTQIIDHVWDSSLDPFSNVVDVYIGYLRDKIDRPSSGKPLIHTVKGLGYKISL